MSERDLSMYKVGPIDTIYYVPDFVSQSEQSFLLHQVNAAPASKWKVLKNRRLQNWGGVVESKGLIQQPLPSWLKEETEKICRETCLFPSPINHVLVNEYLPGQGIMAHQDGPSYFPVVAILSLGSPTVMHFKPHAKLTQQLNKMDETSVVLMPGSLLIFMDSAYEDYLHGIDGTHTEMKVDTACVANLHLLEPATGKKDEQVGHQSGAGKELAVHQSGTRISLTCRYVPKLCRSFIKL